MPLSALHLDVRNVARSSGRLQRLATRLNLQALHLAEYALNFASALLVFAFVYLMLETKLQNTAMLSGRHHLFIADAILSLWVLLMLQGAGAYKPSSGLLRVKDTACVLQATLYSMLLIGPVVWLSAGQASALFVLFTYPILAALLVLEKHLLHALFEVSFRKSSSLKRVLVYGSGISGEKILGILGQSPRLGFFPVALVGPGALAPGGEISDPTCRQSDSTAVQTLRSHRADVVCIATSGLTPEQVSHAVRLALQANLEVAFASDFSPQRFDPVSYTDLDGELLFGTTKPFATHFHQVVSRLIDMVISAIALCALLPVLLGVACLIRFDSAGPVLFRQQRVGKDGKLFVILKFRSMHHADSGDRVSPSTSHDRRITRVGRLLRKTSIDELPQLINVLSGDMALVGPRPEMPFIVAQYTERERSRLGVRPGLTGIWQISKDRCRPIHENLQYDTYYLRNRSVFLDFAILFHTALFAMKGI